VKAGRSSWLMAESTDKFRVQGSTKHCGASSPTGGADRAKVRREEIASLRRFGGLMAH